MADKDADHWNARYRAEGQEWLARGARDLLTANAHLLPPSGLALDAAGGVSANGRYLAERGWRVLVIDISEVALRLALHRARQHQLRMEAAVCDLSRFWFRKNSFDLILNFRFLERSTFASFRKGLRPGGLLFFETFVGPNSEGAMKRHYLRPGELIEHFGDWHILLHSIVGARSSGRSTERLIARKPMQGNIVRGTRDRKRPAAD